MHKGQNTKNPSATNKVFRMYETGESVLPRNENSIGLVAIMFAGRRSPTSKASPIPLANKSTKQFFVSIFLEMLIFLDRNLFHTIGAKATQSEKIKNKAFFKTFPFFAIKHTESKKSKELTTI